jgi:hypothetical protein
MSQTLLYLPDFAARWDAFERGGGHQTYSVYAFAARWL